MSNKKIINFFKRLVLILCVIFVFFLVFPEEVKERIDFAVVYQDTLGLITSRNNAQSVLITKKSSKVGYQGKAVCYVVKNGEKTQQVLWEGTYKNNKKHGVFIAYHLSGEKKEEGRYTNGKKTGRWQYWLENKKGRSIYTLTTHTQDDEVMESSEIISFWDSTGTQILKDGTGSYYQIEKDYIEEGSYINSKQNGNWKAMYASGNIYYQEIWENGELKKGVSYDKNAQQYNYTTLYEMSEFVGGQKAMDSFIQKHFNYPNKALEENIEGVVSVRFFIDETGKIFNMGIEQSANALLNEEATRLVKIMPNWKPCVLRGQKVKTHFVLPIVFNIE